MLELVGKTFSVGEGEYRVVDVRQLSGELMVYAEEMDSNAPAQSQSQVQAQRKPRRAAFHYGDIATRFEAPLLDKPS